MTGVEVEADLEHEGNDTHGRQELQQGPGARREERVGQPAWKAGPEKDPGRHLAHDRGLAQASPGATGGGGHDGQGEERQRSDGVDAPEADLVVPVGEEVWSRVTVVRRDWSSARFATRRPKAVST